MYKRYFKNDFYNINIEKYCKINTSKVLFLGDCSLRNVRLFLEKTNNIKKSELTYNNYNHLISIYDDLKRVFTPNYDIKNSIYFINGVYRDSNRTWIKSSNILEIYQINNSYNESIRESIINSNVIIIGIGCIEYWVNEKTIYNKVPIEVFKNNNIKTICMSEKEIEKYLQKIVNIILENSKNKNIKIMFSLSPVGVRFSNITNTILEDDFYIKALLRISILKLEKKYSKNVYYLPIYEITSYFERENNIRQKDNRHLNQNGIYIMVKILENLILNKKITSSNFSFPKVNTEGKIVGELSMDYNSLNSKFEGKSFIKCLENSI